jgi:hypothetical protein
MEMVYYMVGIQLAVIVGGIVAAKMMRNLLSK